MIFKHPLLLCVFLCTISCCYGALKRVYSLDVSNNICDGEGSQEPDLNGNFTEAKLIEECEGSWYVFC